MKTDIGLLSLEINWTSVFPFLIVKPNFLQYEHYFVTSVWRSSTESAIRTISSANRRLLMVMPCRLMSILRSCIAKLMTNSSKTLKTCGDKIQPCLTPFSNVVISSYCTSVVEVQLLLHFNNWAMPFTNYGVSCIFWPHRLVCPWFYQFATEVSRNMISCPSNRSKQIRETTYNICCFSFKLCRVCCVPAYKLCEFLGFVWIDCWATNPITWNFYSEFLGLISIVVPFS